jgi:hypothetical protein
VSWKKREANTGFMEWGALEVGQDVSGKLNAGSEGQGPPGELVWRAVWAHSRGLRICVLV